VVEFLPIAAGEFLLTERSNADEEKKIDKPVPKKYSLPKDHLGREI
jgi:hypothetical protein